MKIFSAEQVRQWDQFTIANEPILSIDLMERAAQQCSEWLTRMGIDQYPIKIFCGKGNNGGDGLAIARLLAEQGIFSRVYIIEFGSPGTNDFQENLHRLHNYTNEIHFIQDESFFPTIKKEDVVIDALYGSGLNRPLDGLSKKLVEHINSSSARVIAIDVPSGMHVDKSSIGNVIIKAAHTVTFQAPKLSFLLPENEEFVGDLQVLDIGLHNQFPLETDSIYEFVDQTVVSIIYKKRRKFSHKGTFGHALIVAGSKGKMGAAFLSSKACLRSGVGLLTCLVDPIGLDILQTSLPEAMCVTVDDNRDADLPKYSSIGIGPGLGTTGFSLEILRKVLECTQRAMVIDADALNLLAEHKDLMDSIPSNSILTPHPKEYERLFGKTANNFVRLENAFLNAKKYNCYIILKGHYTFLATPSGRGYFNSTGNPGMATAGSGDVLTGILTGLLAQGYTSEEACILGLFIHGLAGDLAADFFSEEGLIAGDIIEHLGFAFKKVST